MFDQLSGRLERALGAWRQRGVLTEDVIREGVRQIRRILLEADVHLDVVRELTRRLEERALGVARLPSVSPGQQLVKLLYDELVELLGGRHQGLAIAPVPPTVILLVGLHGAGKTTTAAKLARRLQREGRRIRLVAADVYRPAAVEQLQTLGQRLGVPVYAEPGQRDVVGLASRALELARRERDGALVIDTAGRLQIDEELLDELRRLAAAVRPHEVLLVADGMLGQEAVRIAQGFDAAVGLTGVVLTKMDGDARGGAALSIYRVLGKPIKFLGTGERPDALEPVHPERLASRILQQGDVLTLVEKAQEAVDRDQAERLERKLRPGGKMDLEDFLVALRQMQNLGPLEQLLRLLPGVNARMLQQVKVDPKRLKHMEAIVLAMTPKERRRPELLNGSRRARIARGAGRPVAEVNAVLKQFAEMQKLLRQVQALQGMFGGRRSPFGRLGR